MSNDDKILLSTLTQVQAQALANAKQKAVGLAHLATEAEGVYNALLTMAMPPGANHFDAGSMSFYHVPTPPVDIAPLAEASEPATDTDDS